MAQRTDELIIEQPTLLCNLVLLRLDLFYTSTVGRPYVGK